MSLKLNERYPGRFDNPSVDYPQGSFKNRTTPDAKDGSYLEKDWANDKEGFFQSLLEVAGVDANGNVDKVGSSQFFDAMLQLKQDQAGVAFTTGGTATALTLTPTPAIQAYAPNQRFSVKFSVTSGTNPTINVSAKGAKSLKQYDGSGAKVAAVFIADQVSDIWYDGTDWVLTNQIVVSASETARGSVELATGAEVAAGADTVRAVTPAGLSANYTQKFALVATEERATGVSPGNNLNGTNVRQLNTVRSNTIAGASLASNQITLPAGSYHVVGSAPFFNGDRHRCYLHNVTDNVAVLLGTSENAGAAFTTRSIVRGMFSIAAKKVFELRHSMQVAQTNGLGDPCADGQAEVYAEIEFVRGGN